MSKLNLQHISSSTSLADLISTINNNFSIISESNGGPVGLTGNPGSAGLAGPRGPVGPLGPVGPSGSRWFSAATINTLSVSAVEGDFGVTTNDGKFYEYTPDGWSLRGSFNFDQGFKLNIESELYNSTYLKAATDIVSLYNSKTNQRLILSNMDKPDPSLGVQIPNEDSPNDVYPFTPGDDATNSYLYAYKLGIFNSGNSEDDAEQINGRNLHLANTFSMITKSGWLKKSGFTVDVNLNEGDINSTGLGLEILKIAGQSSIEGHNHLIDLYNSDVWVGTIRMGKNGKMSIGFSDTYVPSQALDLNGAILLGNSNVNKEGSLRYKDGMFQGRIANEWITLNMTAADLLTSILTDGSSFNSKILDTSSNGGIVVGNYSSGTPKEGSLRYNPITKDIEGYDGTAWKSLTNKVLTSGSGFIDSEGNPISSNIAVNSNDSGNAGDLIYKGFIIRSSDGTISISQSVLESKYAVLDLTTSGSFRTLDDEGNPINASGFNITSNDFDVIKTTSNGIINFALKLANSDKLKAAVNSAFDLRSSDGTVAIEPPSANKPYWNLKSKGGGGLSEEVLERYKPVAARYTNSSDVKDLVYSANLNGHFAYCSFETKDFDENCNIVSLDPLEIQSAEGQSGYYNVSARVRAIVNSAPGGTLASIKLCVVQDNNIIATLEKITTNDSMTVVHNTTKEYELAGSSLVDLSCNVNDCLNKFRLVVIIDYGTTTGEGTITIGDSDISVHRVTSINQQSVDNLITNSKAAFNKIVILDEEDEEDESFESLLLNAELELKKPTYLNLTKVSDRLLIDANMTAIRNNLDPESDILIKTFKSFKIGAHTFNAETNQTFEFLAGSNITLSLTDNKMTISSAAPSMTLLSNSVSVASNITKFNFSSDFSITDAGSGQINITPNYSNVGIKNLAIHVYTDYFTSMSSINVNAPENINNGVINYNDYTSNKAALLKYVASPEEILDNDLGTVTDGSLTNSFVLTPASTAKYSISSIVGVDLIGLSPNLKLTNKYMNTGLCFVSLGIFKVDVEGEYSIVNGTETESASLVKILGSSEIPIKLMRTWGKTNPSIPTSRNSCTRINGTTIIELEQNAKYVFGIMSGVAKNSIDALIPDGNVLNVQTINLESNLKTLLFDSDISIQKIF